MFGAIFIQHVTEAAHENVGVGQSAEPFGLTRLLRGLLRNFEGFRCRTKGEPCFWLGKRTTVPIDYANLTLAKLTHQELGSDPPVKQVMFFNVPHFFHVESVMRKGCAKEFM